ncbi:MAG: hypothetical protein HQM13_15365 [SAR324 cluster bacterium]|nr:hypothetical protein [SAR324 cluster bacterium]
MPTPNKKIDSSNRSVSQLIKTKSILDVNQVIRNWNQEIEQWKEYWKNKQEEYFEKNFDTNSPAVLETSEIRRFFNQFLQRKLSLIQDYDENSKHQALRFILPFNTDDGISEFLLHFFQLETNKEGTLEYIERDNFEKEVRILYDIYKIKKTMECIDVMRKTLRVPEKDFKSQFSNQEKKIILEQLREVLKVLFKFTIRPECQKNLFQSISLDLISPEKILERRENNFFYCFPHVIEKYDYRNLFFLLYFRDGLSAKVGGEKTTFHYNYMNFEILKQEYLIHWLETRLNKNPAKQTIYETYEIENRTIASWIEEDPSQEISLLKKLPVNKFNNLIAQVDEKIETELKIEIPSMSEKHGETAQFKKGTKEAVKFAKSPLEKLKSMFGLSKRTESVPELPQTPPVESEQVADPEPEWRITALIGKQVPYYYLCQSASKYKGMMGMIKTKLGGDFQVLNKLVTDLMNAFGESSVLRRRTPKHDWVVPYSMKYIVGDQSTDYLLILGGEAKVKPKGMGYSTGDEYTYTPYVVFAVAEQDAQYGAIAGERQVGQKTYFEYGIENTSVKNKIVELFQLVKEKEFPGS